MWPSVEPTARPHANPDFSLVSDGSELLTVKQRLTLRVVCPSSALAELTWRQVRRAPIGPGLWPGPRRQARWAGRGLQGQRRAAGASRAAGREAPSALFTAWAVRPGAPEVRP